MAGGVAANNIARWDGSTWSTLGDGVGGPFAEVDSLAVFDDGGGADLYAGGSFTTAGGMTANGIARWNGMTWTALGGGMSGGNITRVSALAVFDGGGGPALYAGGDFAEADGIVVQDIARWDGAAWSDGGGGIDHGRVRALVVYDDGSGSDLFVGGDFDAVGGISANNIATWDGSLWQPLSYREGNGTNDWVQALAIFDDGDGPALFAGGYLRIAERAFSAHFGRYGMDCAFRDGFESGDTTAWTAAIPP